MHTGTVKHGAPRSTKLLRVPIFLAAVALGFSSLAADVRPEEQTDKPLQLPDAGFIARLWAPAQESYAPRANMLYFYRTWSEWGLKGEKLIPFTKDWMHLKRNVGIAMQCSNHKMLPDGLKVQTKYVDGWVGAYIQGETPFYWSDEYVNKLVEFIGCLGDALGDNPYLSFVVIGGFGYGTDGFLVYPDDIEFEAHEAPFKEFGYTEEKREECAWRIVRAYRDAFPKGVRLFGVGNAFVYKTSWDEMQQYMVENNIGRDGPLCGEILGISATGGTWERDRNYIYTEGMDVAWQTLPFLFKGAFDTMEWEKTTPSWDTARILEKSLDFRPIAIVYADGDAYMRKFEADAYKAGLLDTLGLKLGYRIAFTRISYENQVRAGSSMDLELEVCNRGSSPMYMDRPIEVSFMSVSSTHEIRGTGTGLPNPGSGSWPPFSTNTVALRVRLPARVPRGTYDLGIALMDGDERRPDTRLELAMKNGTEDNRYIVGRITVQ